MQIIKSFIKIVFFLSPVFASAQSTYLLQGDKSYQLIDRLEIKRLIDPDKNFSVQKPYSRKFLVQQAELLRSNNDSVKLVLKSTPLSAVDNYNLDHLLMNNSEWVQGDKTAFDSKRPVLKTFYKTKNNLYEVNVKDFYLSINPTLQFVGGSEDKMYFNSRGATIRGMIAKKIGFVTTVCDNQERGPLFVQNKIDTLQAVPGNGFYKDFKGNGVDYFDARGYITFSAVKNYVDIQFGYDKNFIGNGYRSLFLSDWGNSYLFLKLNTRIWKFNYQNLFMELTPEFYNGFRSELLDKKYAAMHHLSMNVTKWLNVGLFESIIFGRKNKFDFQYLNPIIFLRHIEGTIGSPDNALAGLDFKANVAKKFQLYGQFLLDEFNIGKIREGKGWWANKWGLQLGAKYIDAFGIRNLDLQLESNRVRPYTYSHYDSVSNYTHYNQPLAHPLGANFQEFVGIARYQPFPKWYASAKVIYYEQGFDSTGYNSGYSIFRGNSLSDRYNIEDGYVIGGGNPGKCINAILHLSYELRENLFIDAGLQYRKFTITGVPRFNNTTTVYSLGLRLNMFRREYDF